MRRLLGLLLVIMIIIPSFAQEEKKTVSEEKRSISGDKNVLKVNMMSLFLGTGSVFYERRISELTSAQLGVGYMNFKLGDTRFTGLFLTPEVRLYLKKEAIDGFYVAPYFRYHRFEVENKEEADSKGTLTAIGGGLLFGRQWITKSDFTMDLFFGGHYAKSEVSVESGTDNFDSDFFEGFKMRIGFCLGFGF